MSTHTIGKSSKVKVGPFIDVKRKRNEDAAFRMQVSSQKLLSTVHETLLPTARNEFVLGP